MKNFLSIDQGTTSSRSIIFDAYLNLVTDAQEEYDLTYPEDGWVEFCLLYTSPSPRDTAISRMPSSA